MRERGVGEMINTRWYRYGNVWRMVALPCVTVEPARWGGGRPDATACPSPVSGSTGAAKR